MSEGRVLMQKDGETKRVKPGSVEDFQSVGWEKIEDIGETPDITDEVREDAEKIGSSEGDGPIWSERIVIQRNTEKQDGRNIKINLWPPSESHPEYGPTLELVESRNVDGEWRDKRIRLTKGAKTLFLAEMIKQGWKKLREHS